MQNKSPPKLYVNNNLIPTVGQGEDFVYLGRSFNYEMETRAIKTS